MAAVRLRAAISSLSLLGLLAASPAWAIRTPDFIDADQRTHVTLPGDHGEPVLTVAGPAEQPVLPDADPALLPPRQQGQGAAATTVPSPVPEPSGLAMLGMGLLLLLLRPTQQESGNMVKDPERRSTL